MNELKTLQEEKNKIIETLKKCLKTIEEQDKLIKLLEARLNMENYQPTEKSYIQSVDLRSWENSALTRIEII